jgi:hypothetical protein
LLGKPDGANDAASSRSLCCRSCCGACAEAMGACCSAAAICAPYLGGFILIAAVVAAVVIFWGTWARWVALGAAGCVVLAGCWSAGRLPHLSALLLLCGAAVQQCGWWSLYGNLGLWCGLVGGAAALAGAVGFDRAPGHNWEIGDRCGFWGFLGLYALCGALATLFSALADCPTTGSWGDRWDQCAGTSAGTSARTREKWVALLLFASLSLLGLLFTLFFMRKELGRMR